VRRAGFHDATTGGEWPMRPIAEIDSSNSDSLFVEIFGMCLPSSQASEEYLGNSPRFSLYRLFLLYEVPVKHLFGMRDT
jgi:hypothetical protein